MHPASPPISKPTVSNTFTVAIIILGIAAILQIVAVSYAFFYKTQAQQAALSQATAQPNPITPTAPKVKRPQPVATKPTPAPPPPPAAPIRTSAETRVAGLIQQAKKFRDAGDMQAALVKLREADTLSRNDALTASEMAATYELMGLTNKALVQWNRVFEMGDSAGALYQLAKMKIFGDTITNNNTMNSGSGGIPGTAGIQPGSVMGLIDVQANEENDPAAEKKVTLKIGLKARTDISLDVNDVVIQVFFYDLIDNQHIVQTNAQVSSQWTTTPADWADDGIEILEVGYFQPKSQSTETLDIPAETHEYLGYIVRVYYKGELEDVRADPVRLLTLFPPPLEVEN